MKVDLSTVETVTRLAEQFGPFLFAILFILVVTRTAHSYYRDCATRKDPPPSHQELKTYRLYFLCSIWVGIAVMGLSIGWWIYAQSKENHVYQVAVVDLKPDEDVLADYFFKKVDHPAIPGARPAHDRYFLIVQDEPFRIGDRFRFDYFKLSTGPDAVGTGVAGTPVETKYSGNRSDTFRLVLGAQGPRLEAIARRRGSPMPVFASDEIKAARAQYAIAAAARRSGQP